MTEHDSATLRESASRAPRFAAFFGGKKAPAVRMRPEGAEPSAKIPASLKWLRRMAVASVLAAGGLMAGASANLAVAHANDALAATPFDAGPLGSDFASPAQIGAQIAAPSSAPSGMGDLAQKTPAAKSGLDAQAAQAARALGAYQALAEAYSPWLETAGSATLRAHRQNDRAIAAEDRRSQVGQMAADQRQASAEERIQTLRERDPRAFDEQMSQWSLRKASWRQMSFLQIQATLTAQERAEQNLRSKIQESSDLSQASFNEDLSCRASVSEQALAEPADSDGEAFPGLSLPLARAIAAGHELGHCEAAVVFDPANPGRVQALWARLQQQGALGDKLGQDPENARAAFLSLANESFADAEAILLLSRLAGRETARAAALTLAVSRADFGNQERLQDGQSHQTAPALKEVAARMGDPAFSSSLASPRDMQAAALAGARQSLLAWLAAHGAPAASAQQLVDAATNSRAQLQAREQARALLARPGSVTVEDEASAWSGPEEKQRALEGDLRAERLAARRQATILSVADAQLPAPVVASVSPRMRKGP